MALTLLPSRAELAVQSQEISPPASHGRDDKSNIEKH